MKAIAEMSGKNTAQGGTLEGGQKKNAPGGVKRSIAFNYDYTKSFEQQLVDFKNGSFPERDSLLLGGTPRVLQKIGLPQIPMVIDKRHVAAALNGNYKGTQQEMLDHCFTLEEFAMLPQKIADPIAIIQDKRTGKKDASSSVVDVIVEMTAKSGKQVLCAVQVGSSGRISGIRMDTNKVATVHGNTDAVARIIDAIRENEKGNIAVYYMNNKKTTNVIQRAGNPIPSGLNSIDGFVHSISEDASVVKSRIKKATETQQFKRWFGDWQNNPAHASKVVNADGTPLVMYHGTNESFTVFDSSKGKKKLHLNVLGDGNYFTALERGAARYGSNVIAAYLDIKKPYVKADGFNTVADQIANEFGIARDSFTGKDVSSILRARGYDGVVMYDGNGEIVIANAFSSNQIKSATDNIGTFDRSNPDIRYSRELDSEGNELTEAQQKFFRNSEVRNEYGELIPVYHKTTEEFTVFKRSKLGGETLGNASDASFAATSLIGHWFSDSEDTPFFGDAMKTYLNITKPYHTSLDELAADIGDFASDLETMQEHFEAGQYNMVREAARGYVNWMKWNGYDGLIVNDTETGGTSYVILNSRQAKLTDNENPTGRNDIRHSRELETVEELKKQNELLKKQVDYWHGQTAEQ